MGVPVCEGSMEAQGITFRDELERMAAGWSDAFNRFGVWQTLRSLGDEVEARRLREEIAPPRGRVLETFKWVSPERVKVVILGQDPWRCVRVKF